jgi:hypothetical protein
MMANYSVMEFLLPLAILAVAIVFAIFMWGFLTPIVGGLRELLRRGPLTKDTAHRITICCTFTICCLVVGAVGIVAIWAIFAWVGREFAAAVCLCLLLVAFTVKFLHRRRMINSWNSGGYAPNEIVPPQAS